MALVPWDIHLKTGQLVVFAAVLATALVTTVRRRPSRAAPAPQAPA
ncbi:GGDEF domain-containing protein, partial [Streptomyces sp. SID14478]|nr:GGDEF domain-containing protein [Streptomyces sp. SID14478]